MIEILAYMEPLKITVPHLRAMYTYALSIPPMNKWKGMPAEHRIRFRVSASNMHCGLYETDPHTISVSKAQHNNFADALLTMQHEMCHVKCEVDGQGGHEVHDEQFMARAKEVCEVMGYDLKEF